MVVIGTRAGKSILFILPALYSTGVIVIVILLILLRGDIKTRYKKVGIKYVKWDSYKPYKQALVVLVTPELAVSKSFRNFINRQRVIGRLERIVINKYYIVLDLTLGQRTQILGLRNLIKVEIQLVYLTAIIRLDEQGEFIRLIGLLVKKKCYQFQGVITQKNVVYQVRIYNIKEEEKVVAKLVEKKKVLYLIPR